MNIPIDTSAALNYFKTADEKMYQILSSALSSTEPMVVPIAKKPDEYFGSIVSAIVGQQISVSAAKAIRRRVTAALEELTPSAVLNIEFTTLKACGLSEKKTQYIKQNAELWHTISYSSFASMNDEAIITELVKLYGIGRWTAEMFLMFSLARPDVFSFGDLGLMQSLYRNYNYKPHYVRKLNSTVENWSPHRTLASLALWHQKDNSPE